LKIFLHIGLFKCFVNFFINFRHHFFLWEKDQLFEEESSLLPTEDSPEPSILWKYDLFPLWTSHISRQSSRLWNRFSPSKSTLASFGTYSCNYIHKVLKVYVTQSPLFLQLLIWLLRYTNQGCLCKRRSAWLIE